MSDHTPYLIHTIIAAAAAFFVYHPTYAEPLNIGQLKSEVRAYHDSGLYEKELSQAITQAHDFIITEAQSNQQSAHPKSLAIVLDIDETSLSNYDKMAKRDFYATHEILHNETQQADAPAINATLSLYKDALKHNIKVFFVTGREQSELKATENNLKNAGYHDWAGLVLRPEGYHEASISTFKSQARAAIAKQGYTIVASIGDQYSDIKGGYAQKGFKLPNPYYYLP